MKQALIIVDLQNDYFPGGKLELVEIEAAAQQAAQIMQQFRQRQLPILHVQHLSIRPDATFFIPDTPGVAIHASVAPQPGERIMQKNFPNSFRETPLLDALQSAEIEHVVICGAMSHMCIDATTRAAFDFGFRCTVIADACATRNLQFGEKIVAAADVHAAFMAALAAVYANVIAGKDFECQP